MGSIEALAKSDRFKGLGTTSVLSLIVAGYLALTASAFWAFTKTSGQSEDAVEDVVNPGPGSLICYCIPEGEREAAAN